MSEITPGTGYDKSLNLYYGIFLRTLEGLDFDDFLRACPRYADFVSDLDVQKLLLWRNVAVAMLKNESADLALPDNLMDLWKFNELKGQIAGAIIKEIRSGDPRNLEYEGLEKSMDNLNHLLADTVTEHVQSPEFDEKLREMVKPQEKNGNNEETVNAINEMEKELRELREKIKEMELSPKTNMPSPPSKPAQAPLPSPPPRSPLRYSSDKYWKIEVNEADDTPAVREKRETEEGGQIDVTVSCAQGSLRWKVDTSRNGQGILYDRMKRVLVEYLSTGSVLMDLTWSYPEGNEKRIFVPLGEMQDSWKTQGKALFTRNFNGDFQVKVGQSQWQTYIEMREINLHNFKERIIAVVRMVLLSGEEDNENGK